MSMSFQAKPIGLSEAKCNPSNVGVMFENGDYMPNAYSCSGRVVRVISNSNGKASIHVKINNQDYLLVKGWDGHDYNCTPM